MRIAQCIHGLGLGGAQRVVLSLALEDADRRYEHVVYASVEGTFRKDLEANGVTVRILPRRFPKYDPIWIRALRSAMHRDMVQLVHPHLFGDSLHAYLAARSLRIPVVMTLHTDFAAVRSHQKPVYRWLVRHVAQTVACSESVRDSFLKADPQADIVVIPNGIADEFRHPRADRDAILASLGIDKNTIVLGTMGRLHPVKQHSVLLDAMARLRHEARLPVHLLILGEGEERARLERLCQTLGLTDTVTFTGLRRDVARLLAAMDIAVFTSDYEAMPIALLEAMAAERPIVTTDASGFLNCVRPNVESLVVPRRDAAALAKAVRTLASNPVVAQRLAKAARRRFEQDFRAETMVRRYQSLYDEILSSQSVCS